MHKTIAPILLASSTLLLAACASTGGGFSSVGPSGGESSGGESAGGTPAVGPSLVSPAAENEVTREPYQGTRLDVIVPVFDPGLPDDPDDYEKEGVWPELRRAEANGFAIDMKGALQETGVFGAVWVSPDRTATGDLYVLGTIRESNGEDVKIDVEVLDVAGKRWAAKSYSHRVKEYFYRDPRNAGRNPYAPVFEEAARDVADLVRKKKSRDLETLRATSELRFAAAFSEEALGDYLVRSGNRFELAGLPDEHDPMLARTRAIRVQDQLFMDRLQTHYEAFGSRMQSSYAVWQEQSLVEAKAAREASGKALGQTILGGILVGLGTVAAIVNDDNSIAKGLGSVAGIAGGSVLLAQGFQTRAEAKVHREALVELGSSLDLELAPRVVAFEGRTVELTGDAREQYVQWRDFLKRIYAEEATPEKQL